MNLTNLANSRRDLESAFHVLDNGQTKEKSRLYSRKEVTGGIFTNQKDCQNHKANLSSMREFPLRNKNTIWKDRSIFSKKKFPYYEVYSDIGSGLNYKRKALRNILEQLFAGGIKEVVVAHKDRLCRFGFELFEFMFAKHGAILTVFGAEGIKEPLDEFTEDVLSIVTVFTARYYGSRKYKVLQDGQDLSYSDTENIV